MRSFDITRHIDGLYCYAMSLTRDPAFASDLVQETYLRAIPAAQRLREESNVKSWLFTILRNIWLNKLRELKARPILVSLDEEEGQYVAIDTTEDPHTQYMVKDNVLRVRSAIEQLPIEFREVILLREYEELSYREIAGVLGCPAGTVMSRLSRARKQLRALLRFPPLHGDVDDQNKATNRLL